METKQKLILASTSPRRSELLKSAGLAFDIVRPDADESPLPGERPAAFALRTARDKAESVPLPAEAVILAADTVVALGDLILGKPAGAEDARRMLRLLSGSQHEVITGVCLRSADKNRSFAVTTTVLFRDLSASEIDAYVASGDPLDKAGAYAIQGGAAGMVRRIDGSCTNVIGLPLCETLEALRDFYAVNSQISDSQPSESDRHSVSGLSDLRP